MPGTRSPFTAYQSILEPWARLAMKSSHVVNLRLTAMPWLCLTNPAQAAREMEQMFSEKHDAWTETVFTASQAPMQLWLEMMGACWSKNPYIAFNNAFVNCSRRVAQPAYERVKANRKRLTGHG